ncbi:hypothetical protein C8Q78DRAFT_993137 [Trametes maxima]|nr:hypothetical protein C8Q78DRAFT_993137 [Trametes maxima]
MSLSTSLAPAISSVVHDLPILVELTLKHETCCQALDAQCKDLAARIEASKARIAQEKAAQRLLQAQIEYCLRRPGQQHTTGSSRDIEGSSTVPKGDSVAEALKHRWQKDSILASEYDPDESVDLNESPLSLKTKRRCRIFSHDEYDLTKRPRLTVVSVGHSRSAA